ncbi:MAG: hypothetical protein MZV70_49620 [Desulfobacterales bacterium]|nr:hypothetical protein [Desulfobacterales bacterium]
MRWDLKRKNGAKTATDATPGSIGPTSTRPISTRAHLLNVSPSGGYFECEQRIIPGATIFIRLHHGPARVGDPTIRDCMRSTALGEVKWCRELPDQKKRPYGVGIRYHMPV